MDIVDQITTAIGCHHCGGDLGDSVSDLFCGPDCQTAWHASRTQPLTRYREPADLPCHIYNQHERSSPETTPRRPDFVDIRPDLSRFLQAFWAARPFPIERRRWLEPHIANVVISVSGSENFLTDQLTIRVQRADEYAEVTLDQAAYTFRPNQFGDRLVQLLATGRHSLQHALYDAIDETCRVDAWRPGGMMPPHRMTDDDQPAVLGWDPASSHAVLVHGGRVYAGPPMISREQAQRLADEIQNNIRSFAAQAAEAAAVLGRTVGPALQQLAGLAGQLPHDAAPSLAEQMQRALEVRRNRNTGPQHQQRAPRQINPRSGR